MALIRVSYGWRETVHTGELLMATAKKAAKKAAKPEKSAKAKKK